MSKKIEKYLYIVSPILILAGLFYYYITGKFESFSIITIVAGAGIGAIFFVRFFDDVVRKITKRKVKAGVNSTIITVVVLALVVVLYLILMNHTKRVDLTQAKRFSLSEQTIKILERLEGPVKAHAFYSKQQDASSITELFTEYKYHYKDFEFEIIDPDLNPGLVEDMGIEEYGDVVLSYKDKTEEVKSKNEEGLTNALIKLSEVEVKKVYFITGHGERSTDDYSKDGYDKIKAAIKTENFDVEELLLLRAEKVPEDCAVLISAGPKLDYEPHELDLIEDYLLEGGRIVFLIDPGEREDHLINIQMFLERYGIVLGNDVIIDPFSRVLSGDFFMPVINSYTYNPITRDFDLATFFRFARSVGAKESDDTRIFARQVASTGEASWAEKDLITLLSGEGAEFNEGIDEKGPVGIIAYSAINLYDETAEDSEMAEEEEAGGEPGGGPLEDDEEKPVEEAFIFVAGDSDFITNAMYQTQGNKDLFLNTINYLSDRGDLITIRPKQQDSVYLTLTSKQGRIAFFIIMIIIPLFVIFVGIYVNIQRRVKS
jgi:ABC-type uncharacterized transport system involved in gliding motility auxiliary subunit